MYRLTALVCCLLTAIAGFSEEEPQEDLFLSTPEQVADLASASGTLVGGIISPLSGQPVLRQTDLIVKGAQPLVLSRTYIPPCIPYTFPRHKHKPEEHNKKYLFRHLLQNYRGWQFYPHTRLQFNPHSRVVRLSEPDGMTLDFRLSDPNSAAPLASLPYAISNTAGDIPGGQYDPRNTRISSEGDRITVHAADRTVRLYEKKGWATRYSWEYLLEKEILPNGKVLKYQYNEKGQLSRIESLDPKERYTYATLHIAGSPRENGCRFTSSSGMTASYVYEKRMIQGKIKEKIHGRSYKEEFCYSCPPILTSVSSPFYRQESIDYCDKFLIKTYSGKDDIFTAWYSGFGEGAQHYRVYRLLSPVGQNNALEPVYDLSYDPPIAGVRDGTTRVKSGDGVSTVYHFSRNLLVTSIQYFGQDGALAKEKILSWNDRNWLQSIEMRDGRKNLLSSRSYAYDRFGNPVLELFTGDLTGLGVQETFSIRRTFSEDGKNLLLKEEREDGKVICIAYLASTNLETARLVQEGGKILLREFSEYDDCYNLIRKISDDGTDISPDSLSGVTQRTMTRYILRNSSPFLHMPEWIEETYWEDGTEKPLKKSHLVYNQEGNVAQQEVYDAEGVHRFTIYKTCNERGDILSETNPLQQEAVYTFDARGRPETSTSFSKRVSRTFHHDLKGRLRKLSEKGEDGLVHTLSSDYDFQNRLVHRTDPFQNSTHYTYDPLVNEVVRTDFPSASTDGKAIAVTRLSAYDPFGRELARTDPNGNITTYCYNAYGSPIEILHPGGGKESFRYAKNGKLARSTDPDGLTIHYSHDVLGRVLSKTWISPEGETVGKEYFAYNGFNLFSEIDREGTIKSYTCDGAGRKIREECSGRITDFTYDALGWLATICRHNGDNTLLIHYKRDLEGRIIEKYKTDSSGRILHKISYAYDGDGNQAAITRYIHDNEATDTFAYDAFGREVEHIDANGQVTKTVYNENFINPSGQRVLQKTASDPLHISTVETLDALNRTVRIEVLNPRGATLSCQEMSHDPQGNLLYRRDHVYENEHFQNTQTIGYSYTPDHQIATLTRAFGTMDERTTAYTHFPSGKMAVKTLPDGITLAYSYHPLGWLSRLDSSDGRIHHAFAYNRLGYLTSAQDGNLNIAIRRELDPFGNVIQEQFPSGLVIEKEYDAFDRPLSLKMDSQGEVLYAWDPLFLREVTRISNEGEQLYSHVYEEYDLDGNLVAESLIGDSGRVVHATDPKGQKTSISSPWFSQQCTYDPLGNLVSSVTDGEEYSYSYDDLSQLSSENSESRTRTYAHDSLYNRTQKDGDTHEINDLNELLSSGESRGSYDLNGNQLIRETASETFHFTYDPLNRLIEAASDEKKVNFVYDPLGRRLSKTVDDWQGMVSEHYLYDGENEIGAFTSCMVPKNLRVLAFHRQRNNPVTVSVELEGQFFAPLLDLQGNIRRLIDPHLQTIAGSYEFTAFGEELRRDLKENAFNPWRFASKRFDPEAGLVYFGKRYYDPEFGRWLTTDPAGFIDSTNLYQYVFNNPFLYRDPDGRVAFMIPLLAITWKVLAVAIVTACVNYQIEHQHHRANSSFERSFNAVVHQLVQNLGGVSQYALPHILDMGKEEVRTEPKDLDEQIALEEAKANEGKEIMPGKIKDPRYPSSEWKKVEHTHTKPDGKKIEIHYWENRISGGKHGFKFKN